MEPVTLPLRLKLPDIDAEGESVSEAPAEIDADTDGEADIEELPLTEGLLEALEEEIADEENDPLGVDDTEPVAELQPEGV